MNPSRTSPKRRAVARLWLCAWLTVAAALIGHSLWRAEPATDLVASRATAPTNLAPTETRVRRTLKAIEDLRVGDRVLADNPGEASSDQTAVDPATWRLLTLYAEERWPDGTLDTIHITTLQPPVWLEVFGTEVGTEVPPPLDLVEMGLPEDLVTKVAKNEPCPALQPPLSGDDPDRLVLTTVNHLNSDVWELTAEPIRGPPTGAPDQAAAGPPQTLKPTGFHKFYSETRSDWVSTNELEPGEVIRGRAGPLCILRAWPQPGVERVYNLTVEGEHVYYVGDECLLTHNMNCGPETVRLGIDESDYLTLHKRGLTIDDLAKINAGEPGAGRRFISGVSEVLRNRKVGRVVFSLDNLTLPRAVGQLGEIPILNVNTTAHELKTLLGLSSRIRSRGASITYTFNGRSYGNFVDALDESGLAGMIDRRSLDALYSELR